MHNESKKLLILSMDWSMTGLVSDQYKITLKIKIKTRTSKINRWVQK